MNHRWHTHEDRYNRELWYLDDNDRIVGLVRGCAMQKEEWSAVKTDLDKRIPLGGLSHREGRKEGGGDGVRSYGSGAGGGGAMSDNDKYRGLYEKYEVFRTDPEAQKRHERCAYFVLDLTHDPIALKAIQTYEDEARKAGYTQLADDLALARAASVIGSIPGVG
jgi:hypothetical protein